MKLLYVQPLDKGKPLMWLNHIETVRFTIIRSQFSQKFIVRYPRRSR